jgi:rod shape-determining protein MreD
MPSVVSIYRPDWVFVVLGYWALALPTKVNVGVAFFVGLILDILLGTSIGVHSFAMSLSIYVLAANYQRLRNYSVWQQAMIIGILDALYNLIVFWLMHLLTDIYFLLAYMWPVVTSMVIWPWIFWLLRRVRRQLHLN